MKDTQLWRIWFLFRRLCPEHVAEIEPNYYLSGWACNGVGDGPVPVSIDNFWRSVFDVTKFNEKHRVCRAGVP